MLRNTAIRHDRATRTRAQDRNARPEQIENPATDQDVVGTIAEADIHGHKSPFRTAR
jgi:hypothetical protein